MDTGNSGLWLLYLILASFVGIWALTAYFAFKQGYSKVIGLGGGFIVTCIAQIILIGMLVDTPSEPRHTKPTSQAAFERIVSDYADQYRGTDNELRRRQLREQRKVEIGRALNGTEVSEWIGTIERIGANRQGKAILEISLAGDIEIKTWNNAFSDLAHGTLIDQDTSLYKGLMRMNPGDRVLFSGSFFDCENDFVYEASLTERGAMTRSSFIMKFDSVGTL